MFGLVVVYYGLHRVSPSFNYPSPLEHYTFEAVIKKVCQLHTSNRDSFKLFGTVSCAGNPHVKSC